MLNMHNSGNTVYSLAPYTVVPGLETHCHCSTIEKLTPLTSNNSFFFKFFSYIAILINFSNKKLDKVGLTAVFSYKFLVTDYATSFNVTI